MILYLSLGIVLLPWQALVNVKYIPLSIIIVIEYFVLYIYSI